MGLFYLIAGWLGGVLPFTPSTAPPVASSDARTFYIAEQDRTFLIEAEERTYYVV